MSSAYHPSSKIAQVAEKQLGWLTVNKLGPQGEPGTAHPSRGRRAGAQLTTSHHFRPAIQSLLMKFSYCDVQSTV